MQFQRAPYWSLSIDRADYYGWRWCLHVGPVMLWFRKGEARMNWDEAHLLGDLEAQEERGMTDDLVKRFNRRGTITEYDLLSALDRNPTTINAGADICAEAKSTILAQADRIEDLEAKLAKAVVGLVLAKAAINGFVDSGDAFDEIKATLAELTGGKDE